MNTVLEITGAEEGYLILAKEERYYIQARVGERVELLDSLPLDAKQNGIPLLPRSLISYAIRTRKPLVLEQANKHDLFRDDPYIRERKSQSILCAPILHQQNLTGLLYLENNILPGGFTAERLEVLELLSAQIAVSLKNALDYEALQNANKTKSLFLSKMSHELRTPLIGILGQGRLVLQSQGTREEILERVGNIVENGEKLNTFISNILELTQMERRGPEYMGYFSPIDFFERLLAPFRERVGVCNLSFKDRTRLRFLPQEFWADQEGLERLLKNLLDNALKFTKEGGVSFRAAYEERKLRCEVKDTGPGLTLTQQKHIFSPFQQAKEVTLEASGGTNLTGLGLAVSKMLVENMGGTLTLQSTPDKGSLFIVEIPMEATISPVVEEQDPDAPVMDATPETIPGPDPADARELYKLAKNGDVMSILEYTQELELRNPELTLFTREINRMAKGFQERKLTEFVKTFIK